MRHLSSKHGKSIIPFAVFSILLCLLLFVFGVAAQFFSLREEKRSDPTSATPVTVILDAGHGGEDGGAVGKNGVYEKDLNLSIVKLLEKDLAARGISVVCTRNEDVLLYDKNADYKGKKKVLDLAARLQVSRKTENSIFVSIHMNSFPQTQYSGLQVYYSQNDEGSAALAARIQNDVKSQLQPSNTRKTKPASSNIYLLDRITTPAVLIECGFLSNSEECAKLSTEEYRRQLASVLAKAIADYVVSLS